VSRPRSDHVVRREVIARAAASVIADRGLEQLTLRDLAAELGATTGALTHYFPSKDALVAHTKELVFDEWYARARLAAEGPTGRERLHAVVAELLPLDAERCTSWRVLVAFQGSAVGSPELRHAHARRMGRWFAFFEELVADLVPAGAPPTAAADLGMAVALMVEGMAIHFAMLEPPLAPERQLAFAREQVERLVPGAAMMARRAARPVGRRSVVGP
jgi:AcrR family transcriptional regulator